MVPTTLPSLKSVGIVRLLVSTLSLLLVIGRSFAAFQFEQVVPADPDFAQTFGSAVFPEMTEILSVTSPVPHLIMGDASSGTKNKIAYRGSLPNCELPVVIIGKKPDGTIVKYTGTVKLNPIKTEDVTNAVPVNGEDSKLKDLIDNLKSTYTVDVVTKTSTVPAGTSFIGIVLRDKTTGAIVPADTADGIVKDKIKTLSNGLISTRPDCHAKCGGEVCRSVLTVDTAAGMLQPASVASENDRAYSGLPTKWVQQCGKDTLRDADVCGPSTCHNGGTCKSSITGTSNSLCTCAAEKSNEVLGPLCQLLTRSYMSNSASASIITHHSIPSDDTHPQTLTLSFQHMGDCMSGVCTILKVDANSKELLKVDQGRITEPRYTTATLPATPVDLNKMTLLSDRYVQNKRWIDISVSIQLVGGQLKATAIFCSKEETSTCFERTAVSAFSGNLKLDDTLISIGGIFNGCFRNVRLNGRLVDLQPTRTTGDASLTREGCGAQADSCSGTTGYVCGDKSTCYGQLGAKTFGMTCSCQCTNSMRTAAEQITTAAKCTSPCSKDAPIISTGATGHSLAWAMSDGAGIPLDAFAPLTIGLRIRTRQTTADEMVKVDGTGGVTVVVKISDETLSCCVNSNCFAFVPKPVNDGAWHEVWVRVAKTQVITRVDDYERIHAMSSIISVPSAKLSVQLTSSCISGVRLSSIYMPTSDADSTQDSGASASVRLTAGSGVTVGGSCADPASACSCDASTEDCDSSRWGSRVCNCKPGNKRPAGGGSCAAPSGNPCTRLGISCPNIGGACVESGGKWLICH